MHCDKRLFQRERLSGDGFSLYCADVNVLFAVILLIFIGLFFVLRAGIIRFID